MPQAHILIVTQTVKIVLRLLCVLRVLDTASFRRWALALVLPFVGIVAAFGISPDTVTDNITRSLVVEDVVLPQPPAVAEAQSYWHEERIQRGDTLARVIARLKVNDAEAMAFINSAPEARGLFQLVPGRAMRAETTADGKLLTLHYPNGEQVLALTRDEETFSVENTMAEVETRTVSVTGVIRSSLFAATDALHIPDTVAVQLVELFSTEIDFHKDLRKNDRFSVVYEARYDRGEPVGAGRVLSAEFVNQGRTLNVVWFETKPAGHKTEGAYFTLDGRDIRKAFLRSPLEFSRVSSGFTDARYHPILQSWTAHKGVDFVAPLGTKIKATADGIVEFAGVQSGYGNVVILRHHKKYTTLYAHMSGFAPDIKAGAKVQQGDVLGNVGMTGLTTGPHVHFEFRIDDVHYDPQSIAMPTALPIEPELKQQFLQASAPMARTLHLLRDAAPSSTFE